MILLCSSVKNSPGIPTKNIYENMAGEMQKTPIMSLYCKDIGMDCSFETHGSTRNEIMGKFINHAESAHKMQALSADVIFNVQNAIIKYSYK
jgi:predicted small metal-binding protein